MELKDNILVSGNADSTVKIWDILTGPRLQTFSGQSVYSNLVPPPHALSSSCLPFPFPFPPPLTDDIVFPRPAQTNIFEF